MSGLSKKPRGSKADWKHSIIHIPSSTSQLSGLGLNDHLLILICYPVCKGDYVVKNNVC